MRFDQRPLFRYALAVLFAAALVNPAIAQLSPAVAAGPGSADPARNASPPVIRIDNFGSINASYYRGAQPKGSDYADLAAFGIKTVIDLQADGDNADEAGLVQAAGMNFFRIPMSTRVPPTPEQVATFLEIVNDPARQPVYVHCKGGKHRTGVMTAIYRMEKDGWTAAQAFGEMKQYKFGMDVLHPEFKSFVFRYRPTRLAASAPAMR
jgi:uncharacterized protein (TIGR01244 family)